MTDDIIKKALDVRIRNLALEAAINAKCGQSYNEDGHSINDPDKIVSAAKKIEAYLIGDNNK